MGPICNLARIVPAGERSAFLVELARREIKRQKLLKVVANKELIWRDEDNPEFAGDSDTLVKALRGSRRAVWPGSIGTGVE